MRVLLSTYVSDGDCEPMGGLAVRSRARVPLVATGVMPAGVRL